jgi:hypothetical protein
MRLVFVLLITVSCFGQSFDIGVKGGVRATDDLSSNGLSATSESKRFAVGPMAELGLPLGLGLEVNALYRAEGYRTAFGNFAGSFTARERANSWEFPILVKYKLPAPVVKPYVEAGIAPRTLSGYEDFNSISINLQTGQQTFSRGRMNTNWDNSAGVVVGGGIRFGLGRIGVAPELRYTRWTSTPINVSGSQGYGFQSAQNQIDILVGLTWKVR